MSGRTAARLILGTAQFGLPYGVGEARRRLQPGEAGEILAAAWACGVDTLDTAPAYGESERVIGEVRPAGAAFRMISKTPRIGRPEIGADDVRAAGERVRQSLRLLGVASLDALLVHHAPDLLAPGGDALFRALQALREAGTVRRLGVSVYDAATLEAVLSAYPMDVVQLPVNVLDQRFLLEGTLQRLAGRGVEVHARSAFLQGVVLTEPQRLPERFAPLRARIGRFHADAAQAGLTASAAALAFTAGCPGVARVVIGVNSASQLRADVAELAGAGAARARFDFSRYAVADAGLVDPRTWS